LLFGLAFEAGFFYAALADCAAFYTHFPSPQGNCLPLFGFDAAIDFYNLKMIFKV